MFSHILIVNSPNDCREFLKTEYKKDESILFIFLKPEKTGYSINQIRDLIHQTNITYPKTRIYVLEEFDRSSQEAQNAFLKLLEEPPRSISFLLTTTNVHAIVPTIQSRLRIIKTAFRKIDVSLDPLLKTSLDELTEGKRIMMHNTVSPLITRESSSDLFLNLIHYFRNRLATDNKSPLILKEILRNIALVAHNNLNIHLALDHLLIFIHKQYRMELKI